MNKYDLLNKLDEMKVEVSKLTVAERWSYIRWEWLRRNLFYRGIPEDKVFKGIIVDKVTKLFNRNIEWKLNQPTGMYQEYLFRLNKIKGSTISDVDKLSLVELENFFCSFFCRLEEPVDPVHGTWKDCKWLSSSKEFYEYEWKKMFKNSGKQKLLKSLGLIDEIGERNYSFILPYSFVTKTRRNHKEVVQATWDDLIEREVTKARLSTDELVEGLIIYDVHQLILKEKKSSFYKRYIEQDDSTLSEENWNHRVEYREIASVLDIENTPNNDDQSGTTVPAHDRIRKSLKRTTSLVDESFQESYLFEIQDFSQT